jgi:ribosomal protein S18 acetylase RimI-like enzyme
MAIQKQFWGCPADAAAADKYSAYLMDDVIAEARRIQHDDAPYLGLLVHAQNQRAIRVYEKAGFVIVPGVYKDKATGVEYTRMLLDLTLSANEST